MTKLSRRHFIEGVGLAAASLFSGKTAEADSTRAYLRSQASAPPGGLVAVAS